jgi:ferredoxin--NADP+ reductase
MVDVILNATIESRLDLNERYAILRVRPDDQPVPPFTPGQFVQLGLPQPAQPRPGEEHAAGPPRMRIARRSYSIASSANERERYEFFITLVSGGRLTPDLWRIEAGGRCWIDAKAVGSFTLDGVPPESDLVMVATGTGISPYVSMLRTYRDPPRWRRFVMIHGVRYASDLGFRAELEALQMSDPRFRYLPIVSREPGTWTGLQGRVQATLEEKRLLDLAGVQLDPRRCHVFLCGNPAMIQDVRDRLVPKGFTVDTPALRGNLHFEKYW